MPLAAGTLVMLGLDLLTGAFNRRVATLKLHSDRITCLAFSPGAHKGKSNLMACGSADHGISIGVSMIVPDPDQRLGSTSLHANSSRMLLAAQWMPALRHGWARSYGGIMAQWPLSVLQATAVP